MPPARPVVVAAVDIGASGGRVVAGSVSDGGVALDVVHRFANGVVDRQGHLRWDLDAVVAGVETGLARIPDAASIGIDTWAIDYGLLDDDGRVLDDPIAYRDDRTAEAIDEVHALVPPDELYAVNGLQFLPFNTIYQLVADRRAGRLERAAHALLIPDLLAHRLTGALGTELTNASTTGLLDATSRRWSSPLAERIGIRPDLFPELRSPGERRGVTATGVPVLNVGSHDTASAVVGVPATGERFAYVSCGTWALVGLELPDPVLTDAARRANFTNELGVEGRTRFLRNVGGLWLLQECLRDWGRTDLGPLLAAAARLPAGGPQIDVADPAFIAPGDMPARIAAALGTGGDRLDEAAVTRCILDSLAAAFAATIDTAAGLAGRDVEVIHLVGGGAQNTLLCQLVADAAGRPVLAGPAEATALGNVLVQASALGAAPASLDALRAVVVASSPPVRHDPA